MKKEKITWIASYPKSGNTWIRMFLSGYWTGNYDINKCIFYGDMDLYYINVVSPIRLEDLNPTEFMHLKNASLIHRIHTPHLRQGPLLLKTHNANIAIDHCECIPPSLSKQAIYVVRDPRDILPSYAEHNNDSLEVTADKMCDISLMLHSEKRHTFQLISSWRNHVNSWCFNSPFPVFVVKYEDLLNDPKCHFKRMLEFLEWEFDKEKFNKALRETTFQKLRSQEKDNGFDEKKNGEYFFRKGKKGNWKDIPSDLIHELESKQHDTMKTFDYIGETK